jgi:hypothetical protein
MSPVDWGRYNLPALWTLIADVDVCDGADRVLAWDGLAATMRDQHKRLLAAADSLAAVWPPTQNDSALEFQRQVKGLADSMQETLTKAENTKAGLNGVVQAFSTAQSKIRDLAAGRDGVSSDWMPRFVDHAEDRYDEHAQAAMREAEAAIGDHGAQIQSPSLFKMDAGKSDDGTHIKGGGDGTGGSGGGGSVSGLRAIPVPVPASDGPPTTNLPGLGGDGSGLSENVGSDPTGGQGSTGPVLSGLTPVTPSPGGFPNSAPGTGALPGPSTGMGGGGPGGFGVLPIGGGVGAGGIGAVPGVIAAPGNRRPIPVRRGLPSGAVIGEESERGIGTRGAGATGAAGVGVAPMPGGTAGGRGSGRRRGGTVDGDADQQWETQEGVAPVIRPDDAQVRHDPGPGVIGLDR